MQSFGDLTIGKLFTVSLYKQQKKNKTITKNDKIFLRLLIYEKKVVD